MKLYLDSCCYNRPYDDQNQERIHFEGEAVLAIIHKAKENNDEIIGSPILDFELKQIKDNEKREKVKHLYEQTINGRIGHNSDIFKRAKELSEQTNIRTLDRFHLCFAENAGADVLLTTDDKFKKACSKLNLNIKVMNPLKFLMETMRNEYND
jgi:predicted nucleic acid-binding protein